MPTDQALLTLTQWLSPAFPVGAYAYSHGLEWLVETGDVAHAGAVEQWLSDVLEHGAGWNDGLFIAAAYAADTAQDLIGIDATCRAFCASRERLKETRQQGMAFSDTVSEVWHIPLDQLCYPVALGRAARLQELPLPITIRMFLHSFLSNLTSAAMRLVPLGQTEGQRLILGLTPLVTRLSDEIAGRDLDALTSTAFLADIASMKHETQYSRIFRT